MSRSYRDKTAGCGCPMCKPWKHKLDKKYKVSERKKIQKDKDDAGT